MTMRWFPRIHRGVIVTGAAFVLGVATNAIHRNPISGGVIAVTLIALAFWGGQMLVRASDRQEEAERGNNGDMK